MNFFFPIKFDNIKCQLTIPRFKNSSKNSNNKYFLYAIKIEDGKWKIFKKECIKNKDFFILEDNDLNNEENYILTNEKELNEKYKNNFINLNTLNNFTNATPEFRCSLKIFFSGGGFSSYQSEYPFRMTNKSGSVLSPIYTLLNHSADENYICFKNINTNPANEIYKLFILDAKNKDVLDEHIIYSNKLNIIKINKKFIQSNIYIYSEKILGIPIYISIKDKHISMEHTHPPHVYLWGDEKFNLIQNLKKNINEIIFKKII